MLLSRSSVTLFIVGRCVLFLAIGLCGFLIDIVALYGPWPVGSDVIKSFECAGRACFMSLGIILCLSTLVFLSIRLLKLGVQTVRIGKECVSYKQTHMRWNDIRTVHLGIWYLQIRASDGEIIRLSRQRCLCLTGEVQVGAQRVREEGLKTLVQIIQDRSSKSIGQEYVNRIIGGERCFFLPYVSEAIAFLICCSLAFACASISGYPNLVTMVAILGGCMIGSTASLMWIDKEGIGKFVPFRQVAFKDISHVVIRDLPASLDFENTRNLVVTLKESMKFPQIRLKVSAGGDLDLWYGHHPKHVVINALILSLVNQLKPDVEMCQLSPMEPSGWNSKGANEVTD